MAYLFYTLSFISLVLATGAKDYLTPKFITEYMTDNPKLSTSHTSGGFPTYQYQNTFIIAYRLRLLAISNRAFPRSTLTSPQTLQLEILVQGWTNQARRRCSK